MTQRLPIPGSDDGTWGDILNGFLEVSLNSDGTLQTAALTQAGGVLTSSIGQPSGVAGLNSSGLVPTTQLATGTASSSNFLRGDGTWVVPNSGSSTLAADTDVSISSPSNTQVLTYNGSKWVNDNPPTAPDATSSTPGLIQLAGDIGGSATDPTLVATSNVENIISANTTVAGALQKANNLSDVSNSTTARTNLTAAKSGANSDITSLTGLTTPLAVNEGGTGASTLTGVVIGNGASAMTTVTAPAGTIVGTSDTQTLTNKNLTSGTNTFPTFNQNTTGNATTATTATSANGINSATTTVVTNGATAPSANQVLTATSSTAANWQTPASAPVSSVFGRTGAVVATSGDYTASQVTNAADKSSASTQSFTGSLSSSGTVTGTAHIASGLTGATAASRYVGATASGAPASGTFAVGDFVIDQTAKVWVCTTAGTVGSGCVFTQISSANGGVTSFNSRTGAVTPTSGDYTASQVTGALVNTNNLSDVSNSTTARGNLTAAKSGANSDITSLTGLTTPLPLTEGGTGQTTAAAALGALSGQASANFSMNSNKITSLANGSASTDAVAYGQLPAASGNNITSQTGNYTANSGDVVLANATSSAITVTSPAAVIDNIVSVKKTDSSANAVTFTPASGTVDGASSYVLTSQYDSFTFRCDGTNWWVF